MQDAKLQQLTISIAGAVSPSLIAAINKSEAMLRALGASTRTQNAAMRSIYATAFPAMERATSQANKLHDAMSRIGETGLGVAVGEGLVGALETGLSLVERMAEGMKEMAIHASEMASHFEMQSRGIGNLLRNQAFADQLMNQLQTMANASPFQLTELANTARSLAARGVAPGQLLGTVGEIGNIVAGLGGGAGEMERATLAYGEARSGQTLNTREINQLTELGVPIWAELQKFTDKTVEELHKLIEKHMIDSKVLDQIFKDLTTGDGLFADAMEKFSQTFQGEMTTFQDKSAQAERDFGFIVNDWVGDLLKFVNSSSGWDAVHHWMENMRLASQAVLNVAHTLPSGAMDDLFAKLEKPWRDFNKWLGGFFSMVEIPNVGNAIVMNATGEEKIRDAVAKIESIFTQIADFVTSKGVQDLANWSAGGIMTGLENFFNDIKEMIDLAEDIKSGNWGKLIGDLQKYELGGPKTQSQITAQDAVSNAQERLNALVSSGASDDQIQQAKQDLLDAERKRTDATTSGTTSLAEFNHMIDKVSGNDFVHLNLAIDNATAAFLRLTAAMGAGARAGGGFAFGNFPLPGMPAGYSGGTGGVRVEGYGPSYGEFGQTMGNHGNALGMGDYAVSANLAAGHNVGDYFSFVDGRGVAHRGRYEDSSMKAPGVPNRDVIEGWNQPDLGRIKELLWEKKTSAAAPVTINYSPVFHSLVDVDHFQRLLRDHAEHIAHSVRGIFDDQHARSAVV